MPFWRQAFLQNWGGRRGEQFNLMQWASWFHTFLSSYLPGQYMNRPRTGNRAEKTLIILPPSGRNIMELYTLLSSGLAPRLWPTGDFQGLTSIDKPNPSLQAPIMVYHHAKKGQETIIVQESGSFYKHCLNTSCLTAVACYRTTSKQRSTFRRQGH